MARARQAILAAIAAAALASTAAACEGVVQPAVSALTGTARPGVNPLEKLTSYQIIDKAFADTEAAASVTLTGKVFHSRQSTRLATLSLVNGGDGCIADVFQSAIGTFQIIDDGTTAWILPSLDYWKTTGTGDTAAIPSRVVGKYLQVKPGSQGLGTLTNLCSLSTLVGTGPSPARRTGIGAPTATVVAGVPALMIRDTADGGYLTVSDTTKPQLLSFSVPGGNGGTFTFTYFATPVTMAPPPSNEIVDGSQYGL
jgi:hypothetical protein